MDLSVAKKTPGINRNLKWFGWTTNQVKCFTASSSVADYWVLLYVLLHNQLIVLHRKCET